MIILVNENHVVIGYEIFLNGRYETTILTLDEDSIFNSNNHTKIEVDALPDDINELEEFYCYTEETGFYKNPDWSIDLIPYAKQVSLLKEENAKLKDQTSMLTECLLKMSETVYA